MWGCFLMSGVKILHFLKDWWKSIPIHQNYTMALILQKKSLANIRIWEIYFSISFKNICHLNIFNILNVFPTLFWKLWRDHWGGMLICIIFKMDLWHFIRTHGILNLIPLAFEGVMFEIWCILRPIFFLQNTRVGWKVHRLTKKELYVPQQWNLACIKFNLSWY